MSPNDVLAMPVRLYFALEKQIARIRAEADLRQLAVGTSSMGGDGAERVHQALVVEQGQVYHIARERVVKAEPGALDKLRAMM